MPVGVVKAEKVTGKSDETWWEERERERECVHTTATRQNDTIETIRIDTANNAVTAGT